MMTVANVQIVAEYREYWDDGFGARGWKIAPSIEDPRVIASVAHTGSISATCVLVHDMLDHHLCGLSIGGHRNEVVATMLHAMRNGLSVEKSIDMMVDEFVGTGYCGEMLTDFLPHDMMRLVPRRTPAGLVSAVLAGNLGAGNLRQRLTSHYYALGIAGLTSALAKYESRGLSFSARRRVGAGLQRLIEHAEAHILMQGCTTATGTFTISDNVCSLSLRDRQWCFAT